jgi:spermidine synthase
MQPASTPCTIEGGKLRGVAVTVERAPADLNEASVAERAAPGRRRLSLVVFAAGAGTLATEISASRLLAPYFGSSTIVWANIIGLILLYLALGYWLGGRLADRHPDPRVLGWAILVAAAVIAALPFAARPVLDAAVRGFDALSIGAVVGSFFAALALFAVPVTLLGCVSPFSIRLALGHVGEAGTVAGRLYAVSTIGSILGTFISAIVTIPLIGTQRTMVGSAALLATAAALLLGRRWHLVGAAFWLLLFVPAGDIKAGHGVLFEKDSAYQYVQVVQRADGSRVLQLNEGVVAHSIWRGDSVLTGGYWDMFLMLPPLLGRPVERMLVIGDAGGTIPRAYGVYYPQVRIDGVELDPVVSEAGRRYMGLDDNPRLRTITADGRPFLAASSDRYDVIVVDAYRQPYIPFYLATKEFFALTRDRLKPSGSVIVNVGHPRGSDTLENALAATMGKVFKHVARDRIVPTNTMLIGSGARISRGTMVSSPLPSDLVPIARDQGIEPAPLGGEVFTDDRAPVEWLIDTSIVRYAAGEGSG